MLNYRLYSILSLTAPPITISVLITFNSTCTFYDKSLYTMYQLHKPPIKTCINKSLTL